MPCECGCDCCGPVSEDDVRPRAELEQEKRDAERRVEELERRVAALEKEAATT